MALSPGVSCLDYLTLGMEFAGGAARLARLVSVVKIYPVPIQLCRALTLFL